MAKKSLGIPNPFTGGTVYDPSIATQADLYSNVYNQSYNNNRKNPAMAALLGALTLNPAMVVAAPMLANKKNKKLESQYQAGLINVFDDLAKQGASMNAIQQDQQVQNQGQDIIEALRQANQVDPNFPNLVNRQLPPMEGQPAPPQQYVPGMKMADLEKLLNGATGAYNADYGIERLDQVESNKFAGASGLQQPAQLQGGIKSSTQKPIWFPYADKLMEQAQQVMNNARTQGQKQYEFSKEFPSQEAQRQATAKYLQSQTGYENAKKVGQTLENAYAPEKNKTEVQAKQAGIAKINAEIATLANKSNEDNQKAYGAAAGEYSGAVDYLKNLGGLTPTGTPDVAKINADPEMKKAFKEMQNAKAKMKQLERFRVEKPKETPGSKTLEMTAPKADLVKRPWGSFKL